MPSLTVVVGNPTPNSRTKTIADDLARKVAEAVGAEVAPTVDLSQHTEEVFRHPSAALDPLIEQVASSDYAIFATPTYKASYTGLLKAFLDRYGSAGLRGVTAIPVFTIGSPAHSLAVEFTLRPLLVELGASVPTSGLSFEAARFDDRDELLNQWLATQLPLLHRR